MDINIEDLLRRAVSAGASDIHLKVGSPPVVKVGGELDRLDGFEDLTPADTQAIAEAFFTPRAAQDFKDSGTADFAFGRSDVGRFRATAFRQRGSVSVVLRRVVPGARSFAELGLPKVIEKLARADSGLLLVTGPAGSGKTATMASLLDWINAHRAVAILTVEDPIEVLHPDKMSVVVQREVGVDTPTAADAIKSAMRHDADVLLISEINDVETARAAIDAAETGHLVISSMRTNDPADTIDRIISLFPEMQQRVVRGQLASQLLGIVSQRLLDSQGNGKSLACELMTNNERIKEWITGEAGASALVDIIKESEFFGMQTMDASLLKLVVDRAVELPEAIHFARNVHDMRAKAMAAGIQI